MENTIPLSINQRYIWFDEKINGRSAKFNIGGYAKILGEVDEEVLKHSLSTVLQSEEVLRFGFSEKDGVPYQFDEDHHFLIDFIDLSEDKDGDKKCLEWISRSMKLPLSTQAQCYQTALLKSDKTIYWFLKIHHILVDGWAFSLIFKRVANCYNKQIKGVQYAYEGTSFRLFLEDERKYLNSPIYKRDKTFWLQQYESIDITVLGNKSLAPSENISHYLAISNHTYQAIENYCKENQSTLFHFFLGLTSISLYRILGKKDITILLPVLNRSNRKYKGIVGLLMNLIPMNLSMKPNDNFRQLIHNIGKNLREGYRHHQFQFSELTNTLREKGINTTTRCDVRLSYEKYDYEVEIGNSKVKICPLTHGMDTDPLAFFIRDYAGNKEVTFDFNFNQQYFTTAESEAIFNVFSHLLYTVISSEDRPLRELEILEQERVQETLAIAIGEKVQRDDASFLSLFAKQVERNRNGEALSFKNRSLNFQELDIRSTQLARLIMEILDGQEHRVGLLLPRSEMTIIGILGILKAGCSFVPLDPYNPDSRLSKIVKDSDCQVVLCDESFKERVVGLKAEPLLYAKLKSQPSEPVNLEVRKEREAYVIYTSGSTGQPQGVPISIESITDYMLSFASYFEIKPDDKILHQASIAFDTSLEEIFPALISGATIVVAHEEKDFANLLDIVLSEGISVVSTNPYFVDYLNSHGHSLDSLRVVISGGDELKQSYCDRLIAKVPVYNTYGPTESTICATYHKVTKSDTDTIPVGTTIQNREVYILDEFQNILPKGVQGEICLGGTGLTKGYVSNELLNQSKIIVNPIEPEKQLFRTGDIGVLDTDNVLRFAGRKDRQVKIAGVRIELGEVERAINSCKAIKVSHARIIDKTIVAYFLVKEASHITTGLLEAHLKTLLPYYMMPKHLVLLSEFPLSVSGKIDYGQLPKPTLNIDQTENESYSPMEACIRDIWKKTLNIEHVGKHKDFFELGGNSLKANSFLAELFKETGCRLTLRTFFAHPKITEIAQKVDRACDSSTGLTRVDRNTDIPASYEQERIWFIQKLDPENKAYYVPRAIRIKGNISAQLIEDTMSYLIHRHEILRTGFVEVEGLVYQNILRPFRLEVRQVDISHIANTRQKRVESEIIESESTIPFDIEKGPLIRIRLIKNADNLHLLLWSQHHLVHDGWTQGVLIKEFMQVYHALYQKMEINLTPLDIQFADYAYWQRNVLIPNELPRYLSYWKKKLHGVPEEVELPLDRSRPDLFRGKGGQVVRTLAVFSSNRLRDFSKQFGVTLYVTMLTMFKLMIYKFSGQKDFCVGGAFAKRKLANIHGILGMVINTLPLRTPIDPDMSFEDFLHEVSETCLEAMEHEETPFGEIVRSLNLRRDLKNLPLVQICFGFMDTPTKVLKLPESELTVENLHNHTAKFDLMFMVVTPKEQLNNHEMSAHDQITIECEYNAEILNKETVNRMMDGYLNLVEECIRKPQNSLKLLSPLNQKEKLRLTNVHTGQPINDQVNLYMEIQKQAKKVPYQVAIRSAQYHLTYIELIHQVEVLISHLQALNRKTEVVGILMSRSPEMVISVMAALKLGAIYLPLDSTYPKARLEYMLADSGCDVLIVNQEERNLVDFEGPQLVTNEIIHELHHNKSSSFQENPNAYLMYTSGSTGQPKGCLIKQSSLLNYVHFANQYYFECNNVHEFGCFTSISFDLTVTSLFCPLLSGKTLNLFGGEPREAVTEAFHPRYQIEGLKVTPSQLEQVAYLDLPEKHLSLKTLIVGGEKLFSKHVQLARKFGNFPIYNEYGPTEATVACTYHLVADEESDIPIGKPLTNAKVYILDAVLEPVPVGVAGEVYIGGVGVVSGYINQQELTEAKFKANPFAPNERMYATGDWGKWTSEGSIVYLGRKDEQVKIRGYRIELSEIAAQVERFSSISKCHVLAHGKGQQQELLCAYYVSSEKVDENELRTFVTQYLPNYMIPSIFLRIVHMPVTVNGKLDETRLSQFTFVPDPSINRKGFYNEKERELADLWCNVLLLEREDLSPDSNFFRIGGHSLNAVKLQSKIAYSFGVNITLKEIFEYPTISSQAQLLKLTLRNKFYQIPKVEEQGFYEQSSAQKRLFLLDHFEDIGSTYNIITVLRTQQDLDHDRINNSLKELTKRHEILRTSFTMLDDEPIQVIHNQVEFGVEQLDLSAIESEQDLKSYLDKFSGPFDISKPGLFRVGSGVHADGSHILIFELHHIIADGTSMVLLQEEFISTYYGEELPPVAIQYRDYSRWQKHFKRSDKSRLQQKYWKNKLVGATPIALAGRSDHQDNTYSFSGATFKTTLDESDKARLHSLSSRYETTLYVNALALSYLIFYKYTGQEDLVIGTGVSGRRHSDLARVPGMFINMLVMRNFPKGEKAFSDFLREVNRNVTEGFEHQDYQFEDLISDLNFDRKAQRNPLINVSLVVQNYDLAQNVDRLKFERVYYAGGNSKFDFSIFLIEKGEQIDLSIEYSERIFSEEMTKNFVSHFKQVLAQVHLDNEALIETILLSSSDAQLVPKKLVDRAKPRKKPQFEVLHELFVAQARKNPEKACLRHGESTLSFGEVDQKSNQIANYLLSKAFTGKGAIVGLYLADPVLQVLAVLGVLKSGSAYLPIDITLPVDRKRCMINESGVQMILSQEQFSTQLDTLQWDCSSFLSYALLDSTDLNSLESQVQNNLMDTNLWDHVANMAKNEIEGGGWLSSYTGLAISKEEMSEYQQNVVHKLKPYLSKEKKVLEVGVASGITMKGIAPEVGYYLGTDISSQMVTRTKDWISQNLEINFDMIQAGAHELDKVQDKGPFDVIIINSVIQCFPGHIYFKQVLQTCLSLIGEDGIIFLGDIMDLNKKSDLINNLQSANAYLARNSRGLFEDELFISRTFLDDLRYDFPEITDIEHSNKVGKIENELTQFRFDSLLHVKKKYDDKRGLPTKNKCQEDLREINQHSFDPPQTAVSPNSSAYLIYTSGTTANPKAVLTGHRAIYNTINYRVETYQLEEQDKCLQLFNYAFDGYLMSLFTPLASGVEVVLVPKDQIANVSKVIELIREHEVTHLLCIPTYLRSILKEASSSSMTHLKIVTMAGERIDRDLLAQAARTLPHAEIVNEYGVTEASVMSSITRNQQLKSEIVLGTAVEGTGFYVMNVDEQEQEPGMPGELILTGNGLAQGYLNDPDLTHRRFYFDAKRGLRSYKTRDLSRRTTSGVELLGRLDTQFKLRGYRIDLEEIAIHMRQFTTIKEAVVVPLLQESGEAHYLCGYFESDHKVDHSYFKEYLQKYLPPYAVPSTLCQIDKLPLLPSGKIATKYLPIPKPEAEARHFIDDTERQLAVIWQDLLKVEMDSISRDSNFFELGGHSLKVALLQAKIQEVFSTAIQLADIFDNPVLSNLAKALSNGNNDTILTIPTAPNQEYYPLTPQQEQLFLHQYINPTSTSYNVLCSFELPKELSLPRLQKILNLLVFRHESLRSTFKRIDGRPYAEVHNHYPVNLRFVETNENELHTALATDFYGPFDLNQMPPLRCAYVDGGNHRHFLILNIHHIIFDNQSQQILQHELYQLFERRELDANLIHYIDYAYWLANTSETVHFAPHRAFWGDKLKGGLMRLQLPYDYTTKSMSAHTGGTEEIIVSDQRYLNFQGLAIKMGVSKHVLLLSAVHLLLTKLTSQQEIVLGSVVSGRKSTETFKIVGLLAKMVAYRFNFDRNLPLKDTIQEIKDYVNKVLEYQDYPVDHLLTKQSHSAGSSPFSVVFNYMPGHTGLNESNYFLADTLHNLTHNAKYELTFQVFESQDSIKVRLEYNAGLFSSQTATRYLYYLENILQNMGNWLSCALRDIDITTEAERLLKRLVLNKQESPFPKNRTIVDVFHESCQKFPNAVAISHGSHQLTYRELDIRSNKVAHEILRRNHDQLIGVMNNRVPELVISILGILKAGCGYVPLDPNYPLRRLRYIVNDANLKLIVSSNHIQDSFNLTCEWIQLESLQKNSEGDPNISICHSDVAYCIYTSGTTGIPKGVLVEHQNVVRLFHHEDSNFDFSERDIWSFIHSYSFDFSVWEIFGALFFGGKAVMIDQDAKLKPSKILHLLQTKRITVFSQTPSAFYALTAIEQSEPYLPLDLRFVVLGGETLSPRVLMNWHKRHPEASLINMYGITETTVHVTFKHLTYGDIERNSLSIGVPIPTNSCHVLGVDQKEVLIGVPGEIFVGGAGVSRGYLNRPELTHQKFKTIEGQRLYASGDYGKISSDGSLKYLNRKDYQVQLNGYRIELQEIEHYLCQFPGIEEVIVVVRKIGETATLLAAYRSVESIPTSDLINFLKEMLPDYMVPLNYLALDAVPLDQNGKVNQAVLLEQYEQQKVTDESQGKNSLTDTLKLIWAHLLSIPENNISLVSSFFELGGNSILAMRLLHEVEQKFQVEISFKELMECPTIDGMKSFLSDNQNAMTQKKANSEIISI